MSAPTNLSGDQLQKMMDASPMISFLGVQVESWDADKECLTCAIPMQEVFRNIPDTGPHHGGVIASFIDTVTCIALFGKGVKACPTMNIRVDYIRPAVDTGLKCVAQIRRLGRSTATVDADVLNDDGKLVAVGRCSFLILS